MNFHGILLLLGLWQLYFAILDIIGFIGLLMVGQLKLEIIFTKKKLYEYFCFIELNILWAAHQVHHSSEDYNLTTALRQSMIMKFGNWVRILEFSNLHLYN